MRAVLLLTALALVACNATKAIDSTINMEKKMDDMNHKMDTMGKMNSKMDTMVEMDKNMVKMNEAIRLQKMGIALKETMNAETWLPSQAVPGATIFTETATADEIVKIVFVWMRNIVGIDNAVYTPGYADEQRDANLADAQAQARDFKRKKRSWYFGLLAIAYSTPVDKLQEIVDREITRHGQYEETALQLLAMRGQMAAISIDSYKPVNAAGIERLADELEKLQNLTKYEFAAQIKVAIALSDDETIPGFDLNQFLPSVLKVASGKLEGLKTGETPEWQKAIARFHASIDAMTVK